MLRRCGIAVYRPTVTCNMRALKFWTPSSGPTVGESEMGSEQPLRYPFPPLNPRAQHSTPEKGTSALGMVLGADIMLSVLQCT